MNTAKRILVVDDEPSVRYTVEDVLSEAGYRVSTAEHGLRALEEVIRERPDAILLDLSMPVMDGWTFLSRCRSSPGCAQVPVVVMSAEHNLKAQPLLSVQAVVAKPFDLDHLVSVVRDLV